MEKKGQAAMEFLMTYGWAILVVLIAIGALAYFGVLNPSRFLPASCTLMPGLSCDSFKVTGGATGTMVMVVRNGLGDDLTLVNFATASCPVGTAKSLVDGASDTFTSGTCTGLVAGSRFKEDVTITYTQDGIGHTKTGQIVTEIEV